jgi:hypothetical protein
MGRNGTRVPPLQIDCDAVSREVYDCECALHAAHQAQVDAWIGAAADKLHIALVRWQAAHTLQAAPLRHRAGQR